MVISPHPASTVLDDSESTAALLQTYAAGTTHTVSLASYPNSSLPLRTFSSSSVYFVKFINRSFGIKRYLL